MEEYQRVNWEDSPSTATYITAENLNVMDKGIENATNAVTNLENSMSGKVDSTEINAAIEQINAGLSEKEAASNKVNSSDEVTNSNANYPSVEYLEQNYYRYDEVDNFLDSKTPKIYNSTDNYVVQTPSIVSGSYLSKFSCAEETSANFIHTEKIPCDSGDKFKITAAYGYNAPLAVFYNSDGSFNSYYNLSDTIATVVDEIIEIPDGVAYVAFNNYTVNATIVVSKNIPVNITVAEKIAENTENIVENTNDILNLKNSVIYDKMNYNEISVATNTGFYVHYSDGKNYTNSNFSCSTKIPCVQGDSFKVTADYGYSAPLAVFYDSDNNYVDYYGLSTDSITIATDEIVTIPEGVSYVVFNTYKAEMIVSKGTPQTIKIKEQVLYNTNNIESIQNNIAGMQNENSLNGKSIYCDGDSVAYGAGSNGYSYCDFIADNNNMSMTKKAVSGTTLAIRNGRSDSILERVLAMAGNYDYILLEGGFNDMFNLIDIGSVSETDYSGDYDTSTAAGAFEQICYFLVTQYPESKKLFVLGHRILRGSCDTKQPPYWDIFRKICNKWSIPYVDLANESGLIGWYDNDTGYALNDKYFSVGSTGHGDGTHPLKDTYEKFYVPIIEAKLNSL